MNALQTIGWAIAAALVAFTLWKAISTAMWVWADRMPARPTAEEFNPTMFCQGCGHEHQKGDMEWAPAGTYRCVECCSAMFGVDEPPIGTGHW